MHEFSSEHALTAVSLTQQALAHMRALTSSELSPGLRASTGQFAQMLQHLQRLDYLREIAAGVMQFYEQASDIDAATFSVARESSRREDALLVTYCSVRPGGLSNENDPVQYAESLIQNVVVNHGSCVPNNGFAQDAGDFSTKDSSYYEAVTGTNRPGVYTMPTSRAIVLAAADSAGIDGVARTLCPEAWKALSKYLDLPAIEGQELLDMRLTALAVASLFEYAQSLESARLVARKDNASPDSPWTLWINDVAVDDCSPEAPQVLCGRLMMEMRNPDHAWPAELHLLKNNVSALVGACGGAAPEPEVEFHVDRSTVMQHFPEVGPAGSDRLAQALLPLSWAALTGAPTQDDHAIHRPRPR